MNLAEILTKIDLQLLAARDFTSSHDMIKDIRIRNDQPEAGDKTVEISILNPSGATVTVRGVIPAGS